MTERTSPSAGGRGVEPARVPSLAEFIALTHRLHALDGRHTTRVNGQIVRAACPPGETACFLGTAEERAARAEQMRARIAALTARAGPRSSDVGADRREQLNRWHADDQAVSAGQHPDGIDRSRP